MILSTLRSISRLGTKLNASAFEQVRNMSGGHDKVFPLQPSRFQYKKFKDLVHFYAMLGIIPATAVIFYTNVFIGPATLSEIPPDYVPKHWEYYKHPISRFIARYILTNPQQEYEKYMAYAFVESEKRSLRMLEHQVRQKIKERGDFQAYYYRPVLAKYHRRTKEASDYVESILGD